MSFKVNPEAMKLIDFLDVETQEKVKTCVSRYNVPKNNLGYAVYLFFRIWNAVKSVFNRSDWQVAKKAIVATELTDENKLLNKLLPKDPEYRNVITTQLELIFKGRVPFFQTNSIEEKNKVAEDFILNVLKTNLQEPRAILEIEPNNSLTTMVALKDRFANIEVTRKGMIAYGIAEDARKIETLERVLNITPVENRQQMLDHAVIYGIDATTYRKLHAKFIQQCSNVNAQD